MAQKKAEGGVVCGFFKKGFILAKAEWSRGQDARIENFLTSQEIEWDDLSNSGIQSMAVPVLRFKQIIKILQ